MTFTALVSIDRWYLEYILKMIQIRWKVLEIPRKNAHILLESLGKLLEGRDLELVWSKCWKSLENGGDSSMEYCTSMILMIINDDLFHHELQSWELQVVYCHYYEYSIWIYPRVLTVSLSFNYVSWAWFPTASFSEAFSWVVYTFLRLSAQKMPDIFLSPSWCYLA